MWFALTAADRAPENWADSRVGSSHPAVRTLQILNQGESLRSVLKGTTVNTRAVYLHKPEFTFLDTPFPTYLHAQLIKAQQGNVALVTLPVLFQ